MSTTVIQNGTVVTQNPDRDVLDTATIVVEGSTIVDVGTDAGTDVAADRVIDASGHAVIPGFVNAHCHVTDVVLRGLSGTDRGLLDWLYNVKQPAIARMTPEDYELSATLYATETIESGITTFVENDLATPLGDTEPIERKLDVYRRAGLRPLYARGVRDREPDAEFLALIDRITAKEPGVTSPPQERYVAPMDDWIDEIEDLAADYGDADTPGEVWIAPGVVEGMTTEGLQRAVAYAEEHDVMTTTHVAETPEQETGSLSSVEYLSNVGYLGEHSLLGHCVQTSERDVRLLAESGTPVAHNVATNMRLATGFAPVPSMRARGVPVGLGTDSSILSDQTNMFADLRLAALAHKGHHRDPGVVTAQAALDMATIEAAAAVRKADEIGSLEVGKRADVVLVDMDATTMNPAPDVVSALVYQTSGAEVDTVLCDGEVVLDEGRVTGLADEAADLHERVAAAGRRLAAESGVDTTRS